MRSPETHGDDSSPEDLTWKTPLMGAGCDSRVGRGHEERKHFLCVQEMSLKQAHPPRRAREPQQVSDIPCEAIGRLAVQ